MITETMQEVMGPPHPNMFQAERPPEPPPPPHVLREFPASLQFCEVETGTRTVLNLIMQAQAPEDTETSTFMRVVPPFDPSLNPRKRATQVLRHKGGTVIDWEDSVSLAQLAENAVARTYPDVDAVYEAAVGSRTVEYQKAEAAARAYVAAEVKPAPASIFITSHALSNPTGQVQSEAWACQRIIEKADAFEWAVAQMRDVRAASQGRMREAVTLADLESAVQEWDDFIQWMRGILGLSSAAEAPRQN